MEEFESRRVPCASAVADADCGRAGFNIKGIVGWVCVVCRVIIPAVEFRKVVKGVTILVSGPGRC